MATWIESPPARFGEWVLRGVGQVVLQNSPWTGLMILAGLSIVSWVSALDFVVGAAIATGVALAFRADRGLVEAGLFGFAGGWSGLLVGGFAYPDRTYPTLELLWFLVMGGVLAVPLFSACYVACKKLGTSATALPVVILFWALLAGIEYADLPGHAALPQLVPSAEAPAGSYSWATFAGAVTNGLASLFKQQGMLTGLFILVGIALHSRISALMAVLGGLLAAATGWFFHHPEATIRGGEMSFNAILTAVALGGFFFYFDIRGVIYALVGAVLSMWLYVVLSVALAPTGLPVATLPLVLVVWIMMLAANTFQFARLVPLAEISKPEEHLRHAPR